VHVNLIAAGFADTPLPESILGHGYGLDARRDQVHATHSSNGFPTRSTSPRSPFTWSPTSPSRARRSTSTAVVVE
jgi:hypothetical protein